MTIRPITLEVIDIRALQSNRKTVLHLPYELTPSTPYQPGDLLWVREAAYITGRNFASQQNATHSDGRIIAYQAGMDSTALGLAQDHGIKRTAAMKMPRFASRFTLAVESISTISLDQITEMDARKSGVWFDGTHYRGGRHSVRGTLNRHANALDAFHDEWSSMHINSDYSMHRNPLIMRVAFTPIQRNVDEYLAEIEVNSTPAPGMA